MNQFKGQRVTALCSFYTLLNLDLREFGWEV